MVLKMLTELGWSMYVYGENFNRDVENIRNYQTKVAELKNTIIELKNTRGV